MGALAIIAPLAIETVAASRGSGAANLRSPDPREVWADTASGAPATLTIDLGQVRTFDAIALAYLWPAATAATWTIAGGIGAANEFAIQPASPLRVPDLPGDEASRTHALWRGAAVTARYLTLSITQPAGSPPLTAGVLVVGRTFAPALGQEWGAGRRPIDNGAATALPSGGFAVVEGMRKRAFSWTFGDLSPAEADQLDLIAESLGETRPALVIEDAAANPGLRLRMHHGLMRWRQFERRNRRQTRWELEIEEWA